MDDMARIQAALNCIPPDLEREKWARIAMAIKSELGDAGFEIFDTWSKKAANYNAKEVRSTWKSIKPGGGVGLGTLFHIAKEHGWQPTGDYQPPTAEELEQRRRQQQAAQAKAATEAKRLAARAAKRALSLWNQAKPAPDNHGYLLAKGVQAHGLRLFEGDLTLAECACHGALIVPIGDAAGKLHSLEFITAGGEKRFLPDGARPDHFHLLGSLDDPAGWLAICEGYATAASLHEATGWPAAAAFSAGNLLPVAMALRAQYPEARLLLVGDDDHATAGNPGLTKAQEAANAVGAALFVPDFAGIEPRGTDANDLAQAVGLDALKRQIEAATAAAVTEPSAGNTSAKSASDMAKLPKTPRHGAGNGAGTAKAKTAMVEPPTASNPPHRTAAGAGGGGEPSGIEAATAAAVTEPSAGNTSAKSASDTAKPPKTPRHGAGNGAGAAKAQAATVEPPTAPNPPHQPAAGAGGGGEPPSDEKRVGQYSQKNGMTYLVKNSRDGENEVFIPLCNFAASIVEEVHRDDGLEDEAAFMVEGRLSNGHKLLAVEVPARSFAGMAWVPAHWGATAIVYAGQSTKDHLRAGLQMLSGDIPRRTVYAHSGWRKIGEAWHYLHGDGAISAEGQQTGIEVDMGKGHMSRYRLPVPLPAGKFQVAAVRRVLDLLDLSPTNPALGAALLAAVCRAPLGEAYRIDHGIFLAGTTGAQKSEAAALALACFGGFDARSFPANWSDSESDLEAKAHAAKDALHVVDDFKPVGSQSDVQRLHSKADRLFRGVGNQAGRGRRGPDMKGRAAYHARGLVLATGEDVPKGVSLRARLLIVELARGDVDLVLLSALQQAAAAGELAAAMVGFLQWLAPRMDDLKATLPQHIRTLRDKTLAQGWATSHPRAAEMHASLFMGAGLFVSRYAVGIGALATQEADAILDSFSKALRGALERQGEFVRDADECERFFALLRAALSSGRAHLADSLTQGPPDIRPHGWGWRGAPDTPNDKALMRAMGDCIGWVNAKTGHAWLDPENAFATVQGLAREQGDTFTSSTRALWKMLHERGLLAEVYKEGNKLRFCVKKTVGGNRLTVLSLPSEKVEAI